MKRFYKKVSTSERAEGFVVLLDGRPVKTPGRDDLLIPNQALAEALADEWREQGEEVELAAMQLNGLANRAVDGLAKDPAAEIEIIAAFGASDLICYRADGPEALVERQSQAWDPYIDWLEGWLDVRLAVTRGVIHVNQDEDALARLRACVAALNPFVLVALHVQVTLTGSLVIPLGLMEGFRTVDQAWREAVTDDKWSEGKWGVDAEAEARLKNNCRLFLSADRFIKLASS